MKKKMIIAVVFVAVFALAASVTFARMPRFNNDSCCNDRYHRDDCCPKVEIDADTDTRIRNEVEVKADTGGNSIYSFEKNFVQAPCMGFGFFPSKDEANIETGNAKAGNELWNEVLGSAIDVKMPYRGTVEVDADTDTYVSNDVEVKADTGDNRIRASRDANIGTGNATSGNYTDTHVEGSTISVY